MGWDEMERVRRGPLVCRRMIYAIGGVYDLETKVKILCKLLGSGVCTESIHENWYTLS